MTCKKHYLELKLKKEQAKELFEELKNLVN